MFRQVAIKKFQLFFHVFMKQHYLTVGKNCEKSKGVRIPAKF